MKQNEINELTRKVEAMSLEELAAGLEESVKNLEKAMKEEET